MKIELSNEQFRQLMDVMAIADWVLNAMESEEENQSTEYYTLLDQVLKNAKDAGAENLVEKNEENGLLEFSAEFENTSKFMEKIQIFTELNFWDELVERFVQRDMITTHGLKCIEEMSPLEWFTKEEPFRQKYEQEFIENGLENLDLKA